MSEIIRLADAEAVAHEAARRWVEIAQAAVAERGAFRIALSGGNTPRRLYELMASAPWRDQAPWPQSFVFWGDERRVPPSHPDSDYRMARETLLDHVPVPPGHIFRMFGEELANSAKQDYEEKLRRHFGLRAGEWPRFDMILLGLGKDGHIASIFPGTRAISDLSNMVVVYEVPQLRSERMTLTFPVINHARNIIFLVTGEEKAPALAAVFGDVQKPSTFPAQGVQPVDGSLVWLVDEAAASLLKK